MADDQKVESVPEILKQQTTTIEFARKYGKVVIERAIEIGMGDDSIKAMKVRMQKWTEIVATYEADISKVNADTTMKPEDRVSLVNQMRETLDGIREEMFGE